MIEAVCLQKDQLMILFFYPGSFVDPLHRVQLEVVNCFESVSEHSQLVYIVRMPLGRSVTAYWAYWAYCGVLGLITTGLPAYSVTAQY